MDGNRTEENCRYRLVCMLVGRYLGFDACETKREECGFGDGEGGRGKGREGTVEVEMKN
jgi:hypothetical protein